jgi:cytochrome c556
MTRTTSSLSLCLFLASAGPCTEPAAPDSGPVVSETPLTPGSVAEGRRDDQLPRPLTQQTKTDRKYMREHATEAWYTRKAIISGHLRDAAPVVSRIANDAWSPNLRPEYLEHVTLVRAAARSVQNAATLPQAASALGGLGAACAACHREIGGPPASTAPAALAPADPMLAHAAAELALWQGLITPSEESWRQGARALLEAPELDSDVEQVSTIAHRTKALASDALAEKEPRAALYGEIVSTCSTCHTRVGVELP